GQVPIKLVRRVLLIVGVVTVVVMIFLQFLVNAGEELYSQPKFDTKKIVVEGTVKIGSPKNSSALLTLLVTSRDTYSLTNSYNYASTDDLALLRSSIGQQVRVTGLLPGIEESVLGPDGTMLTQVLVIQDIELIE